MATCLAYHSPHNHWLSHQAIQLSKHKHSLLLKAGNLSWSYSSSNSHCRVKIRLLPCKCVKNGNQKIRPLRGKDDSTGGSFSTSLQVASDQPEGDWKWRTTSNELVAYGLLLAAIPIGPLLPHFQYTGALYFLFLAVWSVYVGSHRSLQRSPPQRISFNQGLAVPIMCSASLFGFYCLLRFFPDLDLQKFFSVYLWFVGSLAVASNLVGPVGYVLPDKLSFKTKIDIPEWLLQDNGQPVQFTLTAADCIAFVAGIVATIASRQTGVPFTLNNFIAVCIVTELLNLLSLGSFVTAAATLCGLLLYDVFWVFGSPYVFGDNVMVKVATSTAFEGPMKLIFPNWNENASNMYSILGLGDLAAPGLLIALMLRFDLSRSRDSVEEIDEASEKRGADKTYFQTCLASYMVGLAITVAANTFSGAAQPALLYLVPSLLIGVFIMASYRSEASLLLNFKDDVPVKEE